MSNKIYVKAMCEVCNKVVDVPVPKDLKVNETGLASITYTHGSPAHTLIIYVDENFSVRGEAVIKTKDPKKALSEVKKLKFRRGKILKIKEKCKKMKKD